MGLWAALPTPIEMIGVAAGGLDPHRPWPGAGDAAGGGPWTMAGRPPRALTPRARASTMPASDEEVSDVGWLRAFGFVVRWRPVRALRRPLEQAGRRAGPRVGGRGARPPGGRPP